MFEILFFPIQFREPRTQLYKQFVLKTKPEPKALDLCLWLSGAYLLAQQGTNCIGDEFIT
jgi:hypothetical protein